MKRALALAAAAFLIAAPLAIAQTPQSPPEQTPPVTPTTPPITQPTPTPTDPQPSAPAPSTTPAPAPAMTQSASEPQGCRTRQPAGEQCACLSDTSRIGTSTPNGSGQNICVRPD